MATQPWETMFWEGHSSFYRHPCEQCASACKTQCSEQEKEGDNLPVTFLTSWVWVVNATSTPERRKKEGDRETERAHTSTITMELRGVTWGYAWLEKAPHARTIGTHSYIHSVLQIHTHTVHKIERLGIKIPQCLYAYKLYAYKHKILELYHIKNTNINNIFII